ncbi:SDR family NAD(P)-dependent oxidoreductase [Niveispirillum fermenti]|uniref:SDR family NAD(P)-dependent oxidoreductase n=1 Tax=Niveispirillum fermenti TaxID=1233113 RepID=UPI003A8B7F51
MDLGLAGKKAIVTGSTRGIGRQTVELLAAEGCAVAIGSRNADAVAETVAAIQAAGGTAVGAPVDVSDGPAYRQWIADMGEQLGGVDIFIHNVSGGAGMDGEASWYRCFEGDVMGAFRGCEAVMPFMEKAGGGSIIFMSTTAAVETFMAPMAYNALKGSLIIYAKQLSQVLMAKNIRVNVVSPGPIFIEGGSWDRIKENRPEVYAQNVAVQPSNRLGTPAEVATCLTFLASDAAGWVTGINLVVDGGYTKRVQL